MKKTLFILGFIFISIQIFSQYEVPKLDGAWWKIGEDSPDVSPYNKSGQQAVDFTIYQSTDGKWHCVSCIRYTNYPGSTRLFFRWEADSLTQTNWVQKGIFWTTGTVSDPDAIGFQMGVNTPYTVEGRIQAPHCVKYNGKYYMFHNNAGAFCLISDDGRSWTQWKDKAGNEKFFDMSRDVMIFNDLETSGKWYGCFLQNVTGGAIMAARTADSLNGPWTSTYLNLHEDGNPESPFMIKKGSKYYLWEQMSVFMSDHPYGFHGDALLKMGTGVNNDAYAPEIIEYNGQYYIAGYDNGISICKVKWVLNTDVSLDAYAKNITVAEGIFYPAFDSINTRYYLTVPNSVTNLTITPELSKTTLTYGLFNNTTLPEGKEEVRIAVNSTDKKTSRTYYIDVYRIPASATTQPLIVNNGYQTGSYAAGQEVPVIAIIPAGKVFDKWTGDVTGIADVDKSKTTLTMPSAAASITATFKDAVQYTLTVNSGTGSGSYFGGTLVNISANAPDAGKMFDKWTGDITGIANVNNAGTTLTMPSANAVISATYKDIPPSFALTVTGGTGSGSHPAGTVVAISANAPAAGKVFDKWTGDVTGVANINSESTTITMPSANTSVIATYKDAPIITYMLTVTSGTGSGSYAQSTKVTVAANASSSGKIFDKWTGDVAYLKNTTDSLNEVTMPAKNISIMATYKNKPVSLDESNYNMVVYPNPASDFVNLSNLTNVKQVNIINSQRVIIKAMRVISPEIIINLDEVAAGIYLIQFLDNDGSSVMKRLIIE